MLMNHSSPGAEVSRPDWSLQQISKAYRNSALTLTGTKRPHTAQGLPWALELCSWILHSSLLCLIPSFLILLKQTHSTAKSSNCFARNPFWPLFTHSHHQRIINNNKRFKMKVKTESIVLKGWNQQQGPPVWRLGCTPQQHWDAGLPNLSVSICEMGRNAVPALTCLQAVSCEGQMR